jgi:hypothetical protein
LATDPCGVTADDTHGNHGADRPFTGVVPCRDEDGRDQVIYVDVVDSLGVELQIGDQRAVLTWGQALDLNGQLASAVAVVIRHAMDSETPGEGGLEK